MFNRPLQHRMPHVLNYLPSGTQVMKTSTPTTYKKLKKTQGKADIANLTRKLVAKRPP